MPSRAVLNPILNDDRLTRGLEDTETRLLIEWLVAQVETETLDAADIAGCANAPARSRGSSRCGVMSARRKGRCSWRRRRDSAGRCRRNRWTRAI